MTLPSQHKPLQQFLSLDKTQPVHFIGMGGIGMSGLARILAESGFQVSGSDLRKNTNTCQLAALGATVYLGHQAENVPSNGVVITSTAVPDDNPEIKIARDLGVPVFHRSDVLREILQGETLGHERTVGISGSHGKTSVTGMLGMALQGFKIKPTIVAGGVIPELATNAVLGSNRELAVAELDESDGTLVKYAPTHSIILNMELDHADHYRGGLDELTATFQAYLRGLTHDSQVFFNWACPNTRALCESFDSPTFESILLSPGDIFTGKEPQVTYNLKNARDYDRGCYLGYVYKKNKLMGELSMGIPGMHQLFNGLAAIAVGDQLGFDFDTMARNLSTFSGMGRRFEKVGHYNGALLVDDYAHHPTEVAAMVRAGKEYLSGIGRLIVVFQPHRYTRLKQFWSEFIGSFAGVDVLILMDVYSAGEAPLVGTDSQIFSQEIEASGMVAQVQCHPEADFSDLKERLQSQICPGDLVMSMGAGNITQLLRGWEEG